METLVRVAEPVDAVAEIASRARRNWNLRGDTVPYLDTYYKCKANYYQLIDRLVENSGKLKHNGELYTPVLVDKDRVGKQLHSPDRVPTGIFLCSFRQYRAGNLAVVLVKEVQRELGVAQ